MATTTTYPSIQIAPKPSTTPKTIAPKKRPTNFKESREPTCPIHTFSPSILFPPSSPPTPKPYITRFLPPDFKLTSQDTHLFLAEKQSAFQPTETEFEDSAFLYDLLAEASFLPVPYGEDSII
jgi:hypothetical protein